MLLRLKAELFYWIGPLFGFFLFSAPHALKSARAVLELRKTPKIVSAQRIECM
jgi:hypothetical protein